MVSGKARAVQSCTCMKKHLVVTLSLLSCACLPEETYSTSHVVLSFGGGGGVGGGAGFCATGFENEKPIRRAPPPLMGGTLVALSDGRLVVADPDRNVVWLVAADLSSARSVPLLLYRGPGALPRWRSGRPRR